MRKKRSVRRSDPAGRPVPVLARASRPLSPRAGPFPFWPVRSRFGPCVLPAVAAGRPVPFRPVPPEVKARLEKEGNVERKRSP